MKRFKIAILIVMTLMIIDGSNLQGQDLSSRIFMPDTAFDFGFFAADARVMHSYPVINKGNDTLRIIKIQPGCGCTAAPMSKENLAPGDTATIDVYFDSKRITGLAKKKITILSNDPEQPLKEIFFLAIAAKHHPYVQPKPEVVNFGRLSEQKINKNYTTSLTNITDTLIELEIVDYSKQYIKAELEKTELKPGESCNLIMTLIDIPSNPQYYNFSATLSANVKDIKIHLTIPAVGRVDQGN